MPRFTKKIYGNPVVNLHIAEITGQRTHTRPFVWIGDGKKYSHITGGLVMPTFDQDGFLFTVAVEHETNIIHCLDEFESSDPYQIITKAQQIQEEYGEGVIKNWWGNPVDLMSIVNEVNIEGNPVLISQPIDMDVKDSFAVYTSRLKVALSESHKTLYLNNCDTLRKNILRFVQDKAAKAKDSPVINLVGAVVHTLLMVRPWEQAVAIRPTIPTTTDDYAQYAHEQAIKELYQQVYA